MNEILTAVRTTRHEPTLSVSTDVERHTKQTANVSTNISEPASPEDLLAILKSHPSEEQLQEILSILDPANKKKTNLGFDIRLPGPTSAQFLQTLVNTTIPDHWSSLTQQGAREQDGHVARTRSLLLRCFCSIAGVSALVANLRTLVTAIRSSPERVKDPGRRLTVRDTASLLSALLKPKDFVYRLYDDISSLYDTTSKRQVTWRELCALLAGGRLLSTAAEGLSCIREGTDLASISWIGDGAKYACWLGKNLGYLVNHGQSRDEEYQKSTALIIGRALSLGYTDHIVKELYTGVLDTVADEKGFSATWGLFYDFLRPHEQTAILHSILRNIEKTYFSMEKGQRHVNKDVIGAVATLFSQITKDRSLSGLQVRVCLTTGHGGIIHSLGLRRALMLQYSSDEEALRDILTQCLHKFGDSLYIKHTALQLQEANTQIILLSAGCLHRLHPEEVNNVGKSGLYLSAISNRLAASSSRARLLGMIVGMAISELIEPLGKSLKFDLEEAESEEAKWFLSLTNVKDTFASLDVFRDPEQTRAKPTKRNTFKSLGHPERSKKPSSVPASKIIAIEEITDEEDVEMEDDDLIPYEKPDSDVSDSEEDPTLIQRVKPIVPVYIRDLVSCLKDSENPDRYHLGVTNASSLIRRKAAFGTELVEKIEELALLVIGLDDQYNFPKFHEHRLQSMIALLVAQPVRMGRFFTFTFFDGDLSQTHRSAILTALGLSARELAGYGEEDAKVMGLPSSKSDTSFPSKRLPSHLQGSYTADGEASPVEALTKQLSQTSLQPLALDAADAATGPNALKVRTFSSRMDVERRRQEREAQRKMKSTSQDLHKILTEGYFYPLAGRFGVMMQSTFSSSISYNPFHSPNLLRLFLQTVTLIISTLGPHTPFLPTISEETLSMILSLHASPVSSEPIVLPAVLSLFLAIIDLNVAAGSSGEERLVTDHATQVMELREWTNDVFERTHADNKASSTTSDDNEQTRILAAGILVKIGEVVERYQGRLMGVNVGFKY